MAIDSDLAFAEELRELFQHEQSRPITVTEAANRIHERDLAVRKAALEEAIAVVREWRFDGTSGRETADGIIESLLTLTYEAAK